jgi:NADPH:quinone reductase-like Zn-dependent oxidoreductase
MKAVLLRGYGGPEQLEWGTAPEPKAAPGELKVRVQAASINPVDYKIRRGDLREVRPIQFPAILGRDVAGQVTEIGEGVSGFEVGDRVMGFVSQGYAEFCAAPAEAFAKLRPELEWAEAAALPLAGLTGAQLIEDAVKPDEGQWVLVTGALGSVGRVSVFTAKKRGARVVAGVRRSQRQAAEALDAELIIALDDEKELQDLPELDAIADTVGGDVIGRVIPKLKSGGVLGSVLGEPSNAKQRNLRIHAIFTRPDSQRLAKLGESLAHGDLELPVTQRFPIAEVRAAHAAAETPGAGKIVLLF